MVEEWKEIKGFEGLYSVSNTGRVKSLRKKDKYLTPHISDRGYYKVTLCDNTKRINIRIHRLVAEAFIPNPNNCSEINHKDENKLNNNVSNLEWCTHKYNSNYNDLGNRKAESKKQPVIVYKDGILLYEFESISEAARILKVSNSQVVYAVHSKTHKCREYKILLKEH